MTRGERAAFWSLMLAFAFVAPCCVRPVVAQPERPAWQYVLDVMAALSQPPACQLRDVQSPPIVNLFDTGDEDPFRRTFILRRDFEEWIAYERDFRAAFDEVLTCLRRLSTDAGAR